MSVLNARAHGNCPAADVRACICSAHTKRGAPPGVGRRSLGFDISFAHALRRCKKFVDLLFFHVRGLAAGVHEVAPRPRVLFPPDAVAAGRAVDGVFRVLCVSQQQGHMSPYPKPRTTTFLKKLL